MTQLVVQVTAVLMLAMMLVAVDLTVLVVSTKGQAWQGLLQGLIPVSFLLGRSGREVFSTNFAQINFSQRVGGCR